jgi:hypothetical protein
MLAMRHSYYFYTVWNFTLLTIFFAMAASQSVQASQGGFTLTSAPSSSHFDRMTLVLFEVSSVEDLASSSIPTLLCC